MRRKESNNKKEIKYEERIQLRRNKSNRKKGK